MKKKSQAPTPENRKLTSLDVKEVGGDHFASLAEAQEKALAPLASDMVATLRILLAQGELTIQGGQLVPAGRNEES